MSIKTNILYNSILIISRYVAPLITFPYVSRVLGVTNIGICNFVDSIINYFMLFSMMGITTVGVREIAASKDDKERTSQIFSNLVGLNIIFTFISIAILLICTLSIDQLYQHKELMLVGGIKLIANVCLLEWLYNGLESFRYITIRTLIVRFLYIISVFLFIHEASDYITYFFLTSMMVAVNASINIIYSRKFVRFKFPVSSIKNMIKPSVTIGIYTLLTSAYTTFNITFLGFISTNEQVGYYTTATKLFSIIIALYTAFTTVMIPRMSTLIAKNRIKDGHILIKKAIDCLLAISIPLIIFTLVFSDCIVRVICGMGYEGAYIPTRIVMPLIFIIGYSQILVLQILMPLKCDKQILINSIIGVVVGVILNIALVHKMQATGSSLVWLISEICVMCSAQYFVWKKFHLGFPSLSFIKNCFAYTPTIFVCLYIYMSGYSPAMKLLLGLGCISLYGLFIQVVYLRNTIILGFLKKIYAF